MSQRRGSNTIIFRYWHETEPPWEHPSGLPWILRLAVRWLIAVAGFVMAEALIRGIEFDGWEALLLSALIFVIARALFRPVLILLTCPLQLLTFGLFIFVVNAAILGLTAWLCDIFGIGFRLDGFIAAFLGALVISAVSFLLDRLIRRNVNRPQTV